MRVLRLFVVGVLGFSSVAAIAQITGSGNWAQENSINWRTVRSGTTSLYDSPEVIELNNEGSLRNWWQKSSGNAAATAPRNIDWQKEKAIAIHLGSRPTSGYNVVVDKIIRNGAYATIKIVEETPLRGQYVAEVKTSPWVLIRVERNAAFFKPEWSSREARPAIILGPGGTYIGPKDNDGAGWVDPKYQTNWNTYRSGFESDIREPGVFILRTEGDFQNYYRKAFMGPAPPVSIDWHRYMLVAIHIGERDTTGYAVTVRNVMKDGVYGIVRVVEETPVPGEFVMKRPTQPFVVIQVDRSIASIKIDMSAEQAKKGVVITGGRGG